MNQLTLEITNMHCTSCALNIDCDLEELAGVKSANTDYPTSRSVIQFDPDQVTQDQIIATINQLGYQVSSPHAV